jgi:hypothetical protein
MQLLGGLAGAVVQAWISPDNSFGKAGPGCFAPIKALSNWCALAPHLVA